MAVPSDAAVVGPADVDVGAAPSDVALDPVPGDVPLHDAALVWDSALALDTGASSSPACAALKGLADKGVFTSHRSQGVVFAPDRSWMVLRVHVEDPPGVVHAPKLVRIALPSGEETVLSESGGAAEALGPSGAILLTGMGASGTDMAIYDEGGLRSVATNVCDHVATRDGSRIYAIRDCTSNGTGSLAVIDAKTAKVDAVAASVFAGMLAVSPNGEWAAFVAPTTNSLGLPGRGMTVVSVHGDRYAIPSRPGVTFFSFLSDSQLLFTRTTSEYPVMAHIRNEVVTHGVGSGDQATSLATNVEVGPFGYQVSADRSLLLLGQSRMVDGGPIMPGWLFATPLAQNNRHNITSNLLPSWDYDVAINAFAFSAVGDQVVYVTYDNGVWSYSTAAETSSKLSANGMFVMSPTRAEVAIREMNDEAGPGGRLRLVALDSGADVVSFGSSAALDQVQFLPDGRGLLFVETGELEPGTRSSRLRFISSTHGNGLALAQWQNTLLSSSNPAHDYPTGSYPVDPTGCFTIADVDVAPGPGTRLILLPE